MEILETLKKWADCELHLSSKKLKSISAKDKHVIKWYFFGSCDVCAQAMGLNDNDFQHLYRQTLKHISIPKEEIEEAIAIWMLDKIQEDELFFIKHGAHSFREFKNKPNGVGGLEFCFLQLSKSKNKFQQWN